MGTHDVKYVASALQEVPPRVDEKREICNGPELKSCQQESGPLDMGSLKEVDKGCASDVPMKGGSEGCTLTPPVKGSEGCTLTPPIVREDGGRTPMSLQKETVGPLVAREDGEVNTVYMEKWIIDSGSAYDVTKRGEVEMQFKSILQDPGKAHFDTANGRTASNDRVSVFIEQMPVNVKPWLLEHAPHGAYKMDLISFGNDLKCRILRGPTGRFYHWKSTAFSLP